MYRQSHVQQSFSKSAIRYNEYAGLQAEVLAGALRRARQYFPKQALILDAGAGTGSFAREAEASWRSVSLDLALGMCETARAYGVAVNAPMEQMPFKQGVFDAVFSSLALQWVAQVDRVASEMRHAVKTGGHLVITSFGPSTLQELKRAFSEVDSFPHVNEFIALEQLQAMFVSAGFKLVSADAEIKTEYYSDVWGIMKYLKNIGATNKRVARKSALTTLNDFLSMEKAYNLLRTDSGIPVTWEIYYMVFKAV